MESTDLLAMMLQIRGQLRGLGHFLEGVYVAGGQVLDSPDFAEPALPDHRQVLVVFLICENGGIVLLIEDATHIVDDAAAHLLCLLVLYPLSCLFPFSFAFFTFLVTIVGPETP